MKKERKEWNKRTILREALLGMAKNLGPGQRLPTISTLCRSLGVSNATLDSVLRELEELRVIERHHGKGIFISPNITKMVIGVVCGENIFDDYHSPFWRQLFHEVGRCAGEFHLKIRTYIDAEESHFAFEPEQLEDDLHTNKLHGLFLLTPIHHPKLEKLIQETRLPLVSFGFPTTYWIDLDNDAVFHASIQYVLGKNFSSIIWIGQSQEMSHRFQAILKNQKKKLVFYDWSLETLMKWDSSRFMECKNREEVIFLQTKNTFSEKNLNSLPEVVVSFDDTMTRGFIHALYGLGLWPSENVTILTTANQGSPILQPYQDYLNQYIFNPTDCAQEGLRILYSLLHGHPVVANPLRIHPQFYEQKQLIKGR